MTSLPAHMTVARLHGPGDLRLHDEPCPVPAAGEVLLRVTSVGLCGSDRHWFQDGGIGGTTLEEPLVLGHEFAGVIASGPDTGVRVVAEPAVPCGTCRTCRGGSMELDLQGLVSHVVDLDDVASAFGLLMHRAGHKIVVRP